jgi:chemotaxis signal transduction protein
VVETALQRGPSALGIVVDGVDEVMNIVAEEIEPTPDFGESVNTGFMKGCGEEPHRREGAARSGPRADAARGIESLSSGL